jgi:hypothetical protein
MAVGMVGQSQGASGVSFDFKPKKAEETIVDKENKENNQMKPGIANQTKPSEEDNQNLEEVKGVQEVDAKV